MSLLIQPNIIVAIDHAGAKVFGVQHARAGASAAEIAPAPPPHFLHELNPEAHDADREETYPQDKSFFEQVTVACKSANRIVLIGHGKGQSNKAHHLSTYLATHHPDVAARVLPALTADLSHITDGQLIELGHTALHASVTQPVL